MPSRGLLLSIIAVILAAFILVGAGGYFNLDVHAQVQPSSLATVTGLTAVDVQTGGRIFLSWNEKPEDIGAYFFRVYREESNSSIGYQLAGTLGWNFFEDRGLTNGTAYKYTIVPVDKNQQEFYGPSDNLGNASVVPTKTKNIMTEDIVVVMERQYAAVYPAYQTKLEELITAVNGIYSKNMSKQFRINDIRFFDHNKYCDYSRPYDKCKELFEDKSFYVPGAISMFFGDLGLVQEGVIWTEPAIYIMAQTCSVSRSQGCDWLTTAVPQYVVMVAHELAHSFGVASPEYYAYENKFDSSGVNPIWQGNSLLPNGYENSPMTSKVGWGLPLAQIQTLSFDPLAKTIIEKNYDHNIPLTPFFRGFESLPRKIKIKVLDSLTSMGIGGADIKVFCIGATAHGTPVNETSPRMIFQTDSSGLATLQEFITASNGALISKNNNILNYTCSSNLLKIYHPAYDPTVIPMGLIQLQEEKIVRGSDDYTIIAGLASLFVAADLSQDGRVDVVDLGIFLSNWGKITKPSSDINQDGIVDIRDLGILLSNWD